MCSAINVTVTPSPFTVVAEGENITLSCQVTQRRRSGSLPVVRWMFQPDSGGEELLVVRVNMWRAKFYGNYTKSFSKPKMKLTVVKQGKIYNLLIMNISERDGVFTAAGSKSSRSIRNDGKRPPTARPPRSSEVCSYAVVSRVGN